MGTHPIFESDFDCLTEWVEIEADPDHLNDEDLEIAIGNDQGREIVVEEKIHFERQNRKSKRKSKPKMILIVVKIKPEDVEMNRITGALIDVKQERNESPRRGN